MPENTLSSFSKWYEKNKKEFNRKRRENYRKDEDARLAIVERQREYRRNNPTPRRDVPLTKEVSGREQAVMRIGVVAKEVGRTDQVLRMWEKKGIIPKPSVTSTHRYYTLRQVELLKGLAEVMDEVRYKPAIRADAIEKKSNEVFGLWEE